MKHFVLFITALLSLFLLQTVSSAQQIADSGISGAISPEPETISDITLEYNIENAIIKGFVASGMNDFPVQLGAFRRRINAQAFLNEVREYIDRNAIMVDEDGFFKVRISKSPIPGKISGKGKEVIEETQQVAQNRININSPGTFQEIVIGAGTAETKNDTGLLSDNIITEQAVAVTPAEILFLNEDNPWLKRIDYFGKSISFVNSLIATIAFSITTMLVLLIVILLNRRRMEKEEKLRQYLLEKYQGLILDYLFSNANPDDFRPIASDTFRRQVLIDQMIDVSINLKGEEEKKLLSLYKHLGLDRDSVRRARDKRWHKKIKGFRELAFMNIRDANEEIYKALNSSNDILRMEAQIALVRLGDENSFEFLSHLTRPFSLWEQISLHEMIIQHDIPVPPFKQWLKSENTTVAMFALRMIREFKQNDAEDDVRETIMHPEPEVKKLAIQVAGDMEMRSTLGTMKRMYKDQDYGICLEIVKAMGKMPDLSMMGFLTLVLDKEDDVQLQIEATKAIENNGEEGVKALVKLMKSEYKNYNIIVRHVLDRRIY